MDSWTEDNNIHKKFEEQSSIQNLPWSKPQITGFTDLSNPLHLNVASELNQVHNHPTINLFSSMCKQLNVNEITIKKADYIPSSPLHFRTEFQNDPIPINAEEIQSERTVAALLPPDSFNVQINHQMTTFMKRMIQVSVNDISLGSTETFINPVEPIGCTAFIMDHGDIVSQEWNFVTPSFAPFFNQENTTLKASFETHGFSENAFFVVLFDRVFMLDGGEVCDAFYKKPSDKNAIAATQMRNKSWPKFNNAFMPFAFTFIPIASIFQENLTELPSAILLEKELTFDYLQNMIDRSLSGKNPSQIPIKLSLSASQLKICSEEELDDSIIIHSLLPFPSYQDPDLRNDFVIRIGSTKVESKGNIFRNYLIELSMLSDEGNTIRVAPSMFEADKFSMQTYSRVQYHSKSPDFCTTIAFKLPYNLTQKTSLNITLYNIDEKDQKMVNIGNGNIQLINDKGLFLSNGEHPIQIHFTDPNAIKQISSFNLIITTSLFSNFYTTQEPLLSVFTPDENLLYPPSIGTIENPILFNYFFQIIDTCLNCLKKDPTNSVRCILELNKLANEDIGSYKSLMGSYVEMFACRNGQPIHKELLSGWSQMSSIFMGAGHERTDVHASEFLFSIIIKSIAVSKDRSFRNELQEFVDKWGTSVVPLTSSGLMVAKELCRNFGTFINQLTDLGYYSASIDSIITFISKFGDTIPDHQAILEFITIALTPRLFIALTVGEYTKLVILFQDLFKRSSANINSIFAQSFYNIPSLLLSYLPCDDETRTTIASNLISLFDSLIINMNLSDNFFKHLLSSYAYIMRYCDLDNLKKYLEKIMENNYNIDSFFQKLHFILIKSKFLKTTEEASLQAVHSSLHSIEEREREISTTKNLNSTGKTIRNFATLKKINKLDEIKTVQGFNMKSEDPSSQAQHNLIRDVSADCQLGIVHVMDLMLQLKEKEFSCIPSHVLMLVYRLLSINISIDVVDGMMSVLTTLFKQHTKIVIESAKPPLVLLLKKLFSLSAAGCTYVANGFVKAIRQLFESEAIKYPSNNRTLMACVRAISLLHSDEVTNPILLKAFSSKANYDKCIAELSETLSKLCKVIKEMKVLEELGSDPSNQLSSVQTNARFSGNFSTISTMSSIIVTNNSEPLIPSRTHIEANVYTDMNNPVLPYNIERYSDLLFQKIEILKRSPDACVEVIQHLQSFNLKTGYHTESLMCSLFQCAYIIQYLTSMNKMPIIYEQNDPIHIFTSLCQASEIIVPSEDISKDLPRIPGFCDSPSFSAIGVFTTINSISKTAKLSRNFELFVEVTQLTYKIFENHFLFKSLSQIFKEVANTYPVIQSLSSDLERMFGRYYRIGFYGECFGEENGVQYIYRETKLAHLFDVTSKIQKTFSKLYPDTPIEIIKESGKVDPMILDKKKGFIQITSLNAYFLKTEERNTAYERGTHINSFFFEAPFTKGGKKLQGDVASQWLRKTILHPKWMMPSVTKRVVVPPKGLEIIEYEPIKVANKQIKDRLAAYRAALDSKDIVQIQPLLHGSLLVQVNEGPTKMAEVFLGPDKPQTKYTQKMRNLFRQFLLLNGQALELLGEWVKQNPGQSALLEALENGYEKISNTLLPYLK